MRMCSTAKIPIASLIAAAVTVMGQASSPQTGAHDGVARVISGLVSALNSKSESVMTQFVNSNLVSNAPVEQRVKRWMGLAENGAPFKIVRELEWSNDQSTSILVDRLGNRIALISHFEAQPRVKLLGIQLAPAYTREGLAPELANWTNLANLSAKIAKKSQAPAMGIAMIRRGVPSEVATGVTKVGGKIHVLPGQVWSIGSIGKPLCATVIGRLIELGRLRWNETLKEALPSVAMNSDCAQITLEQLMHHRGGIRPDLGFKEAEVRAIVGEAKSPSQIRANYGRDILKQKPVVPPGSQFIYSNAGYAVLSLVAEKAYGKSYEQILKDLVFKPLGLDHSFTGTDKLPTARPSGHTDDGYKLTPQDATGPMEFMFAGAGGGIYMSVGDLARFGQAHLIGLNGKDGFMKAATVLRLHSGEAEGQRLPRKYACGWGIETLPNMEPFHGHNGSNGTMRAELAIFPSAGLVVAAAVNRGGEAEPSPAMEAVLAIGARYAPRSK